MGKKEKEKKGKGAEKNQKTKKGGVQEEDDIESMVKAIEEEEKKRQEVKEVVCKPPSHRSNFSITAHPDNPEIIIFGGEFYNGKKTDVKKDLFIYNLKRGEWSSVQSPGGPTARTAHQAVCVPQLGGQLWVFGGEFTSASESQFYHYRDLWCFHFSSRRWEKVVSPGGPSARSGHRMVHHKKWLIVFGGFHDNLKDSKYFNDVFAFDLENRSWTKLITQGTEPSPRSACQFFPTNDGRLVVFGGYCKEKGKKGKEAGRAHQDMFLLSQDKHDETGARWRWQAVKQVGVRPSLRTGCSNAVARDRVFLFGGVADEEEADDESDEERDEDIDKEDDDDSDEESDNDSDEEVDSTFYNDLFTVTVEGNQATWHKVQLTGRKGDEEDTELDMAGRVEKMGLEDSKEPKPVEPVEPVEPVQPVESEPSKLPNTVVEPSDLSFLGSLGAAGGAVRDVFLPSPRFNSGLVFKSGNLYLFGGQLESGEKDLTLKDFYCLDTKKLDTWNTIIEDDCRTMEWLTPVEEDDDDLEEEDDEDEESGMETD